MALTLAACAGGGGYRAVSDERTDAAELQAKLGQEYISKGDFETAQEKLQRAVQLDPNLASAHTLLGILNERINRPELAEQFYRKAVKLKPDDGAASNNLGAFLCAQGRFEESLPYFDKAVQDPFYKTPAVAFTNQGVCARKAGQRSRAEESLRRALELEPRNTVALYEMASLSFNKEDYLRARAFIQRFEAHNRADPSLLALAVRVENRLGDERAAKRYRDRLVSEYPDIELPSDLQSETP
ncbi:type IV pilus biogenesis/stability protein PilW [Pseudomarimonas arenosa]|uniref:Type IV pilus biogenesis/stability protein PilW n=1 Tax=Pseudomarimonas arenosa TaxID=2774145 RepID=A0AAW3ZHL9_9GAMM|nr:type IV pilus biogenesis/stability protein PilW [Pseudomarimonas arenosa]MBD8525293.1 type IV pilus biogenesis/stability protein PilW [Pseudomarimonas arenosa]